MSAAIAASGLGADVVLVDENERLGGQLIKQTHMFFGAQAQFAGVRGIDIATRLETRLAETKTTVLQGTTVTGIYERKLLALLQGEEFFCLEAEKVVAATGASENMLSFVNNDLPGVYGAGAVQTLMNVHGVRPGRRALMVGSGNIGLIVSYQLLQAGVEVVAVVEALPRIGGYAVHAAKIRRAGVPILCSHTIEAAEGHDQVEAAVVARVDEDWRRVPGSRRRFEVDVICLAVGLSPLAELLWQAGCAMRFVPELGGHVPWHSPSMETSVPGIYVAEDLSGIEEACTAMMEGELAGINAALALKGETLEGRGRSREVERELAEFRCGPFGEKARVGQHRLHELGPAGAWVI
jgi:sarcosine oxidase subunit alpha